MGEIEKWGQIMQREKYRNTQEKLWMKERPAEVVCLFSHITASFELNNLDLISLAAVHNDCNQVTSNKTSLEVKDKHRLVSLCQVVNTSYHPNQQHKQMQWIYVTFSRYNRKTHNDNLRK